MFDVKPEPFKGQNIRYQYLPLRRVRTVDVKPGPFEGFECSMFILGAEDWIGGAAEAEMSYLCLQGLGLYRGLCRHDGKDNGSYQLWFGVEAYCSRV